MFKKLLLILAINVTFVVFAQQQQFYSFGYQERYGITDLAGEEIVAPIYYGQSFMISEKSDFIFLGNRNHSVLLINKFSGEQEPLEYVDDSYLYEKGGKEYFYMKLGNDGLLMNNINLKERIKLPKQYIKAKYGANYFVGYTKVGEVNDVVDILDLSKMKIVLKDLELQYFVGYKLEGSEKYVYIIQKENSTLFLDENLKQFDAVNYAITEEEDFEKYLIKKHKISFDHNAIEIGMSQEREFPFIKATMVNNYIQYYIFHSEVERVPFFKIRDLKFEIFTNSFDNIVELRTKSSHKMVLKFSTYPESKKVILPKKYWKVVGLQLNVLK